MGPVVSMHARLQKGVAHNCQRYQERTRSTLFCKPVPSSQKTTLKMLILRPLFKIAIHNKRCENDDNSGRPLNTQYLQCQRDILRQVYIQSSHS